MFLCFKGRWFEVIERWRRRTFFVFLCSGFLLKIQRIGKKYNTAACLSSRNSPVCVNFSRAAFSTWDLQSNRLRNSEMKRIREKMQYMKIYDSIWQTCDHVADNSRCLICDRMKQSSIGLPTRNAWIVLRSYRGEVGLRSPKGQFRAASFVPLTSITVNRRTKRENRDHHLWSIPRLCGW